MSLARVTDYTTALEAHLARMRLEAEGIPAYVIHEHYIANDWTMSRALGGVKVCVPASCAERAREILAAHDRGEFALEDESPLSCPRCGGGTIHRERFSWVIAVLFIHLATLPLPFRWASLRCQSCAHVWPQPAARAYSLATLAVVGALASLAIGSLAVTVHCVKLSILNGIEIATFCQ